MLDDNSYASSSSTSGSFTVSRGSDDEDTTGTGTTGTSGTSGGLGGMSAGLIVVVLIIGGVLYIVFRKK